jgi:lipoprotein NlpI
LTRGGGVERADATRVLHETPRDDDAQKWRDVLLGLLRQALSEAELQRRLEQGAALSDEEAARLALSD